ncbi:hypothetical protein BS47DRAFT_1376987 [Hydnum rufescens UP504]|uniref:Signal recognition particle subunit SRP68 n=1 Tax=Hydnum rufescens UP504 TaxID=1448309 RepID=A0A9P6AUV5_9AGAM|nr:hypothetical protein BS47DRAFT_1376987 [Hydnum rufescens UP504]
MASTLLTIRALSLVNEERNTYGLRSNEYVRYRNHCSNKIQRLRQKLKLTHGKGREYKSAPPVPQENLTDGHLQLILYEAERAWTYSQDLTSAPGGLEDGTILKSRAELLFPTRLQASSFLEIQAYFLILNGRFLLRRDEFVPALQYLAVARSVLDQLSASATASRDQALYTLFSDEIAPQIRLSAHSLGRKQAYDIDAIVSEVVPNVRPSLIPTYDLIIGKLSEERLGANGQTRTLLREFVWEGQPVPIRNPELVDVFLKIQIAEDALRAGQGNDAHVSRENNKEDGTNAKKLKSKGSRGKIAAYDDVLLALTDAEQVARTLTESNQRSGGGPSTSGARDIHFVHDFVVFRLLSRRIERDLLLQTAKQTNKGKQKETVAADPRLNPGLVKIFDTILQSLEHMRSLSIVDESVDLLPAVEGRLAYSKLGGDVLYLARTYASLKKYAESLALSSKAHLYLREARSIFASSGPISEDFYPVTLDDVAAAPLDQRSHSKSRFLRRAFNYVELPMENLIARSTAASKTAATPAPAEIQSPVVKSTPAPGEPSGETRKDREKRSTKVEEAPPPETKVKIVQSSSLGLGGI